MTRLGHRRTGVLAFAILLGAGAAQAQSGSEKILASRSLDDPADYGLKISASEEEAVEGKRAARIETVWPVTVNLATVNKTVSGKSQVQYRAKLKTENLNGEAYLEMWLHFPGGKKYFSRALQTPLTGSSDWTELTAPFSLKDGQSADKATLNVVVEGKGIVFVDDIQLVQAPLL